MCLALLLKKRAGQLIPRRFEYMYFVIEVFLPSSLDFEPRLLYAIDSGQQSPQPISPTKISLTSLLLATEPRVVYLLM